MATISQKTFAKIKKEQIKPRPRWFFLIKNDVLWFTAFVSALVGAIGMAIIIFNLLNSDWFIYRASPEHRLPLSNLANDIPLIWLSLLLVTVIVAYYNIEHSKSGYRWQPVWIIFASIGFSVGFGLLFNVIGFAANIDTILGNKVASYRSVEKQSKELWLTIDKGRLGGQLINVDNKIMKVRDLNGQDWQVDVSQVNSTLPSPGLGIKIIGEKTGEHAFKAQKIYPWPLMPAVACQNACERK